MQRGNGMNAVEMLRRAQNNIPSGLDPVKNMCQRWYHSSIMKNDILYIYGGYETFVESNKHGARTGNVTMGTNNYMISVGMNESWNWTMASASLPLVSEQVFVPDSESSNAFSSVVLKGALFSGSPGGNQIYLYGGTEQSMNTSFYGYPDPTSPNQTLLSYDVTQNQWDSINVDSTIPEKPSSGSSADVPDQGLGFYFNGEINPGSSTETTSIPEGSSVPLEGMVMLNMTDNTTRNISTSAIDTNSRTGGILQYIPGIGENGKGILIQFGGMYRQAGNLSNELGTLAPMDQINIFDINSVYDGKNGTWYTQQASGNLPPRRIDSCTVVAAAPDNSSYNIYLYGGQDGDSVSYDDVFVLSLPSFKWIQVYEAVPGSPRFGHTCHLVGNRQMLTVGGAQKKYSSYCDWESSGVAIYDMYALSWTSAFHHDANSYIVPGNITDAIGGNGFAQITRPSKDFTNADVASLFNQTLLGTGTDNSSNANTTGGITSNSTALVSSPTNNIHHGASTGVIAGATIGAVAAVLILSYLLWIWRRSFMAAGTKDQGEARAESRQSLILEDAKAADWVRANVMSIAYDSSNPCHVPGIEGRTEQVHGKVES
ncbi:hypothetical protein sscle_05g043440 [Sclerotinia sclerotiorum 1980 UF-70]|uniref:Cell wall anchored protein n=2 Tax=Sclerotinia sclerotiorum (strain ATCC 18683 / 1980 / Ss-1) TaxID=665079 RepID=A0A1D9Q3P5_SCLS1|nr:hypothetical protein sscle_05g043440 [Sclerotinia sclerotiorum 1980 UF-70]